MSTRPISSSNRYHQPPEGACEAVLANQDTIAGPVRLPRSRASDFVDQFNRIYGRLGLKLTMAPSVIAQPAKSPEVSATLSADRSVDVPAKP